MTDSEPEGWQFEVPRYRATRALRPAEKARYRSESPFSTIFENDVWQYGEQPIATGEIIETKSWPHPSFYPLNYSAGPRAGFF